MFKKDDPFEFFHECMDCTLGIAKKILTKVDMPTNNLLPFSIGLHGGLDYGRVWLEDDNSDKMHFGYGGGFWLSPVNIAILSFDYYQSSDDNVFIVKVGHSF